MLSKKLLTALKKATGKKDSHPLTNTFHIIEKDKEKWLFATNSFKLFAIKLSDEYTLTPGAYSIDIIGELEKYNTNNELIKPLQDNATHYTQSPDFWTIIPPMDTEQAFLSDMKFNPDYLAEMIDFIAIATGDKIPTITGIRMYQGKPATYQTNNIIALLMPIRK